VVERMFVLVLWRAVDGLHRVSAKSFNDFRAKRGLAMNCNLTLRVRDKLENESGMFFFIINSCFLPILARVRKKSSLHPCNPNFLLVAMRNALNFAGPL
jgi:hypothetical protein